MAGSKQRGALWLVLHLGSARWLYGGGDRFCCWAWFWCYPYPSSSEISRLYSPVGVGVKLTCKYVGFRGPWCEGGMRVVSSIIVGSGVLFETGSGGVHVVKDLETS
jgi:hypothetical protein